MLPFFLDSVHYKATVSAAAVPAAIPATLPRRAHMDSRGKQSSAHTHRLYNGVTKRAEDAWEGCAWAGVAFARIFVTTLYSLSQKGQGTFRKDVHGPVSVDEDVPRHARHLLIVGYPLCNIKERAPKHASP